MDGMSRCALLCCVICCGCWVINVLYPSIYLNFLVTGRDGAHFCSTNYILIICNHSAQHIRLA